MMSWFSKETVTSHIWNKWHSVRRKEIVTSNYGGGCNTEIRYKSLVQRRSCKVCNFIEERVVKEK